MKSYLQCCKLSCEVSQSVLITIIIRNVKKRISVYFILFQAVQAFCCFLCPESLGGFQKSLLYRGQGIPTSFIVASPTVREIRYRFTVYARIYRKGFASDGHIVVTLEQTDRTLVQRKR